jgi:hypothetical protein
LTETIIEWVIKSLRALFSAHVLRLRCTRSPFSPCPCFARANPNKETASRLISTMLVGRCLVVVVRSSTMLPNRTRPPKLTGDARVLDQALLFYINRSAINHTVQVAHIQDLSYCPIEKPLSIFLVLLLVLHSLKISYSQLETKVSIPLSGPVVKSSCSFRFFTYLNHITRKFTSNYSPINISCCPTIPGIQA